MGNIYCSITLLLCSIYVFFTYPMGTLAYRAYQYVIELMISGIRPLGKRIYLTMHEC